VTQCNSPVNSTEGIHLAASATARFCIDLASPLSFRLTDCLSLVLCRRPSRLPISRFRPRVVIIRLSRLATTILALPEMAASQGTSACPTIASDREIGATLGKVRDACSNAHASTSARSDELLSPYIPSIEVATKDSSVPDTSMAVPPSSACVAEPATLWRTMLQRMAWLWIMTVDRTGFPPVSLVVCDWMFR
jgi:hypothetical protein